jgi:hypothetical protein
MPARKRGGTRPGTAAQPPQRRRLAGTGEEEATRRRHAGHCAAVAKQHIAQRHGPGHLAALRRYGETTRWLSTREIPRAAAAATLAAFASCSECT